jgi:hypothetical protein
VASREDGRSSAAATAAAALAAEGGGKGGGGGGGAAAAAAAVAAAAAAAAAAVLRLFLARSARSPRVLRMSGGGREFIGLSRKSDRRKSDKKVSVPTSSHVDQEVILGCSLYRLGNNWE